jgi:toxin HigB-1
MITLYDSTVLCYHKAMIKTFGCKETEKIFRGSFSRKMPTDIQRIALRKLTQIHAAETLDFLRVPPANFLEKLAGDREGQWSIRINDQWRICFVWKDGHAYDVNIIDYH